MTDRLFVYGTLRERSGHPMHEVLAANATLLGAATVRGELYRVDWYPALVLGDPGHDVHGDVWELRDHSIVHELDDYEGSEYERRPLPVRLGDGTELTADAYVYLGATEGLDLVEGGDWLAQT